MPIHKVQGGFQWGTHGKVYPTRAGAERQARAAYAHGYRENKPDSPVVKAMMKRKNKDRPHGR